MSAQRFFLVITFLVSISLLVLTGAIIAGCTQDEAAPAAISEDNNDMEKKENKEKENTEQVHTVSLYFADAADGLLKEQRDIKVKEEELKKEILREIIKGPNDPELERTIPAETEVYNVSLKNSTAVVDFSQEFQAEHWGGSTGEMFSVYSVVNSLSELPDVEKVQFLIEGEEVDTLAGHLELKEAIGPYWDLVQD